MADNDGKVLSLKDLKKENEGELSPEEQQKAADEAAEEAKEAEEEEAAQVAADAAKEKEEEEAAAEAARANETEEETKAREEKEAEESEGNDAWMESDLEDNDAPAISDTEAGKIRRKYKAQATKAKDEAEVLREENARLKAQQAAPAAGKTPGEPKRDDFESDLLYLEARQDWRSATTQLEQHTAFTARKTKEAQDADAIAVGESVDEHYLRAEKLAGKSNITPEAYQAADQRVRNAVEAKFHGAGDLMVDKLIQIVGEGSERVFYHLGVNKARLATFMASFDKDQGLSAATFLGTLNAELKAPTKRVSSAPAPGEDVRGDTREKPGDKKASEAYKRAFKSGDTQKAWDIKRKAKKAGVDTKDW